MGRFRKQPLTEFGARVRRLCEIHGIDQSMLSERSKVSKSEITSLIVGYKGRQLLPNAKTLHSISKVLNVSMEYLLTGVERGEEG